MKIRSVGHGESAPPLLVYALEYAQHGWAVLPLHTNAGDGSCSCSNQACTSIGKHPLTKHGSKQASKEIAAICGWWQLWPSANVGIATGRASGIVVIDVDLRHGGEQSWAELVAQHGLSETLRVQTGGGFHFYYSIAGQMLPNKVGIRPGIDIRGEGGYVVAPPSRHASGFYYDWLTPFDLQLLAPLPSSLVSLVSEKVTGKAAIRSTFPSGTRNNALTSIGGLLRRQGLEQAGISEALKAVNESICEPPLGPKEVQGIAGSVASYASLREHAWTDPQPLPEIKAFVPRMGDEYLPQVLRPWAADICDRMQIPLEFVAAPALVTLSSVVGRQMGIYPKQKDDWFVTPNLWGAVIARPGFFKSPAITEALKPLEHLVKRERAKYEAALIVARSKEDIIRAQIEGIKDNVKKTVRKGNQHELSALQGQLEEALRELDSLQVKERRFKTNDATVEKLGALLLDNPDGILVFRDELSGWLKSLQKAGREGDREFFLESWNGYGSYTVDRIGRGTLHIPSLCLSVFGGLQPGKLESYISSALFGGEGDDGLLQRFQVFVYPDTPKSWKNVDRKPKVEYQDSVRKLFETLAAVGERLQSQDSKAIGLRFDREAQEIFNEWREVLEQRLRREDNDTPAFESHLSKYRSMVPSLALIFHLCDYPDLSVQEVSKAAIQLAIKWATLLEAHAKKIYANVIHSDLTSAHALAKKINAGQVADATTVRSVYRKCWANLENARQVDAALAVLEDLGWLRVESRKVAKTSRDEIHLNPKCTQAKSLIN